jgi:hypothetical protein
MEKTILFFLLFCASLFRADAQFFKAVPTPTGSVQQSYIDENVFSVLIYEGNYNDSIHGLTERHGLYEKTDSGWNKIWTLNLNMSSGDFLLKYQKIKDAYYFIGGFGRISQSDVRTALLIYEKGSVTKVLFQNQFGAAYSEATGGTYTYADRTLSAVINDTIILPVKICKDSIQFRIGVRYYPGGIDTIVLPRQSLTDVYQAPNGEIYVATLNSNVWKRLDGRYPQEDLKIDLSFTSADSSLSWPLSNLQKGPANGTYVATSFDIPGLTGIYQHNRWFSMKGSSEFRFIQVIYHNEIPYARAYNKSGNMHLLVFENQAWKDIADLGSCNRIAAYKGVLYAFNLNSSPKLFRMADGAGKLSGYVYLDNDSNCSKGSSEAIYPFAMVNIQPGNITVSADENGHFTCFLDSGKYNVSLRGGQYESSPCLQLKNVLVKPAEYSTLDVGVRILKKKDLSVKMSSSAGNLARRGGNTAFYLYVENKGNYDVKAAEIIITYDKRWTNFSTNSIYQVLDSGKIRMIIPNPGRNKSCYFSMYADPNKLFLNDQTSFHVMIRDTADKDTIKEDNPKDNSDSIKKKIVASCDPNQKLANPSVTKDANVKEIRYHIDFQNIGNDSAVNIRVVDTLDPRILLDKIVFTGGSHPHRIDIKNNVITWTFPEIMLAPSSVNYERSMGFVTFTASLDQPLAANDSLKNRAHIYFDYEDAVITNYAVSKYDPFLGNSIPEYAKIKNPGTLKAYPNPASEELYISMETEGLHRVSIYDAMGRLAGEYRQNGKGELMISTAALPAGVYFVKDEAGRFAQVVIAR